MEALPVTPDAVVANGTMFTSAIFASRPRENELLSDELLRAAAAVRKVASDHGFEAEDLEHLKCYTTVAGQRDALRAALLGVFPGAQSISITEVSALPPAAGGEARVSLEGITRL